MKNEGPQTPDEKEEPTSPSRRNLLRSLGAVVATGAVVGVAHLVNTSGEKPKKDPPPFFEGKTPYEIPVENLSREEIIEEIVHNEERILKLHALAEANSPDISEGNPANLYIEYFLGRFRATGKMPTRKEIEVEIELLEGRNRQLLTVREETPQA